MEIFIKINNIYFKVEWPIVADLNIKIENQGIYEIKIKKTKGVR